MTILLALTILFAVACGWYDARAIAMDEQIDHTSRWVFRALVVVVAVVFECIISDRATLSILPACLALGAAFSIAFRLSLNLLRRKRWWYLGRMSGLRRKGDSRYDGAFHWLAWRLSGSHRVEGYPDYPEDMPAMLAYGIEAAVAISILLGLL